ncbi:PREDICTED: gamma-glutamyl hydrolase-like [Nanorana parkeri]|uniref:gamma-glutamyl hydrolase-like n=1 Tax=Nanorana parkeri TaxID=125878 RepID=UPI0008544A24|nr:PREDICTED: gamma-glutamyl hydrolase-like [Nanorana parkeri]
MRWCPALVSCIGVLRWCPALVSCVGLLRWSPALVSCVGLLRWCPALVSCVGVLRWCPALVSCVGVLRWCPALVSCVGVLRWCPALVSCVGLLRWSPALVSCVGVLRWCPALVSCVGVLRWCPALVSCVGVLRWCPALVSCVGLLRWSPALVSCVGVLRWCPALVSCVGVLRWSPALVSCVGLLRWSPALVSCVGVLRWCPVLVSCVGVLCWCPVLLLPGGAVDLLTSSFSQTAGIFYNLSIKAASSGTYFPIWGTCMGFQVLTALTSGENLLSKTPADNISLPLNLTDDISSSRMFRRAPPELLRVATTENITANFHHFGLTPEGFFANKKLSEFYRILSTNRDRNGAQFISTIEARDYPIYGVQWHPEVNRFQWNRGYAYPHSENAVWISQYMANFFVHEARKNLNHFPNAEEEESALIYNWSPTYTGNISGYEMVYFF